MEAALSPARRIHALSRPGRGRIYDVYISLTLVPLWEIEYTC